jgi:hypothetical protein
MKTILATLFVALYIGKVSAADTANTRLVEKINRFITACEQQESGGDDKAIGDTHLSKWAYGHLQIRQDAVTDVNDRFGTTYKAQDMRGNRALSVWVCQEYLKRYATRSRLGHEPTYTDLARIWNGGPCGPFDNGAINRKGDLLKDPKKRADLARAQSRAKQYARELTAILNSQMIAAK